MANNKRTIVASKRARNQRKKASRAEAKAALLAQCNVDDAMAQRPEDDSGSFSPTDSSSGDEDASHSVRRAAPVDVVSHVADNDEPTQDEKEDSQQDQDDDGGEGEDTSDEGEMVVVCPLICTEFVPSLDGVEVEETTPRMSKFTVRIPAFRETRTGFTTYSIQVITADDAHRQFQLERRYSEFVALASALHEYFQSREYEVLRQLRDHGDKTAVHYTTHTPFTWELPPKTWFKMTQTTALEDRRSKLEWCLQSLLAHDPKLICQIPLVRDFLMLDTFGEQVFEESMMQCV